MSYNSDYILKKEKTGLNELITNTSNNEPTPPQLLEQKEDGGVLTRMIEKASSPEELEMIKAIEDVIDIAYLLKTGKAIRGELRKRFTSAGFSDRAYYNTLKKVGRLI